MKIVIIDNYDSFTFNLVHLVRELGCSPCVLRNDRFDPESLADFDKILLSPGPGIPSEWFACDTLSRFFCIKFR